jgi:ribonucleoside-diphosphate reductase alpha chain
MATPRSEHLKPGKTNGSDEAKPPAPANGGIAPTPKAQSGYGSMSAYSLADRIKTARLKGYEGDPCPECGALTLVRSGACAKCDTCGSTSGCG